MAATLNEWHNLRNLYFTFIHIAVLVLAIEVVVLAGQNRELKRMMESPKPIEVGSTFVLGPLLALTSGAVVDTTSTTLIYVFSTRCGVCRKNVPAWTAVAHTASQGRCQVMAISVDSASSTISFVKDSLIQYPVFVASDAKAFRQSNQVNFVPQTILRNAAGRVERVWAGLMSDSVKIDIVQALPAYDNNQ